MKIIESSFNEIRQENPQKHIEEIARTCYKSNDLITDDSHKRFIKNLYDRKHWAMLEHFIFIYKIPGYYYKIIKDSEIRYIIHSCTNVTDEHRYIISFSARSLLDGIEAVHNKMITESGVLTILEHLIKQTIYDYDCQELFGNAYEAENCMNKMIPIHDVSVLTPHEQYLHGWKSIRFTCDRGVSHEIVRHRDASFAQESTRYCNYIKDKFGQEITVIRPCLWKVDSKQMKIWEKACDFAESAYFDLLISGATAQEARTVLPNSLKTEIIMTARNYEWDHFFELRCDKAAHPQMRELAIPLNDYFIESNSTIFTKKGVR